MYTYVIYLNRLSNIPCSLVLSFSPPVFSSFTYTSSVPPNPPHPKVICVNNLHHNHPCFFPTFIYVCGHGYIYVCGYIYVYMFIYECIYVCTYPRQWLFYRSDNITYSFQLFAILSQYFLVEHPSSTSYALIHYSKWLCNIQSVLFVCHSEQYWIKHAHTDIMTRWWLTERRQILRSGTIRSKGAIFLILIRH